jgi:hypothetical protein
MCPGKSRNITFVTKATYADPLSTEKRTIWMIAYQYHIPDSVTKHTAVAMFTVIVS